MIGILILRVIHYLLSLAAFIKQWVIRFPSFPLKKNDYASAHSDARHIQKLPLHLGMVYLEEELSYSDIANAILWTAAMGISYISIYDLGGALKQNEKTLYDCLEKNRHHLDSELSKTDIMLNNGICKKDRNRSSSSVDVFILSLEDGKQCIASTARSICSRVATKQFSPADITPLTVDTLIQDETSYPDPDLVIKFGRVESLLGFMPWHVRLTEILSIPSHVGLDYKTFKSVLVTYSRTHQRFGK